MSNFSCEEFLIFLSYALLKLTVFIEKPLTRAGGCALRREHRVGCHLSPLGRDFPGYLSGGQEQGQHGD